MTGVLECIAIREVHARIEGGLGERSSFPLALIQSQMNCFDVILRTPFANISQNRTLQELESSQTNDTLELLQFPT